LDEIIDDVDASPVRERSVQNRLASDLPFFLKRNLTARGTEVHLEGVGRIDILAENDNGDLVVIELKVVTPTRDVVAQILSYMGALAKQYPTKRIEGLIIAPDFDIPTISAASTSSAITLLRLMISWEPKIVKVDGTDLDSHLAQDSSPSSWQWRLMLPQFMVTSPDGNTCSVLEKDIVPAQGIRIASAVVPFWKIDILGDGYQAKLFRDKWKVPSRNP
jgi:hypothetical protein